MRALVTGMDPGLPLDSAMTMDQRRSNSVAEARFYTVLLGTFAGLALLIDSHEYRTRAPRSPPSPTAPVIDSGL